MEENDGQMVSSGVPSERKRWSSNHLQSQERFTESSEDTKELIDFTFAGEQSSIVRDLREDRADAPKIHTGRVRLRTEQNLRRPIPERHHLR